MRSGRLVANLVHLAHVMLDRLPAIIFGSLLVAGGALMLWAHVRTWRSRRGDSSLSEDDRRYFQRQFRRRLQVSSLVILIGIMLPIGDLEAPWREHPGGWAVYWFIVLGMALWVMFLAWGDLVSTRTYSQAAMARLREQQRALEQEAARLRAQATNSRSDA